jgi:hypothetical protein
MMARCYQANKPDFHLWGGRGIRVCDEWFDFARFVADMGESRPGMQLDRIDNNGNYRKDNCRWVTRKVQCRNQRTNRMVDFMGKVLPLAEWCELMAMDYNVVKLRLYDGWSAIDALTTPKRQWTKRP